MLFQRKGAPKRLGLSAYWMTMNREPLIAAMDENLPMLKNWIVRGWILFPKNERWLVVSTHLKNISQIGNLPQVGVKIKHI